MTKQSVVIATPSKIDQVRLAKTLDAAGAFQVVAQTTDLSATFTKVELLIPDFVLISDVFMEIDEYQCMASLFRAVNARVISIHADVSNSGDASVSDIGKQTIHARMDAGTIHSIMREATLDTSVPNKVAPPVRATPNANLDYRNDKVILIGASTGGIDALSTILQHFPKNCPPTAIVQHTGQNFSETLARLLDRSCAADVILAEDGVKMQNGQICLAGGINGHLKLLQRGGDLVCKVAEGPPTMGHVPSIDELFLSAQPFGTKVVAALLTGMGRDGANGLLSLLRAGATTIAQDKATSVVYGMPRVAFELGAVQHQMPIGDIGPFILQNCAVGHLRKREASI